LKDGTFGIDQFMEISLEDEVQIENEALEHSFGKLTLMIQNLVANHQFKILKSLI